MEYPTMDVWAEQEPGEDGLAVFTIYLKESDHGFSQQGRATMQSVPVLHRSIDDGVRVVQESGMPSSFPQQCG